MARPTQRATLVLVLATGLGCSEPEPRCEADLLGACQSFAQLVEAVPEGVQASDWIAAATAAHERTRDLIGKYYTGEIGVWRGSVSAVDSDDAFVDAAALASLGHFARAQNSYRMDLCELALFSPAQRMRLVVEQPMQEPGVSYFSTVASSGTNGGMLLSCVDCLPNWCELPDPDILQINGLEVTGTKLDDSPFALSLSAELTPVDPWTLSVDNLLALSALRSQQDLGEIERLQTCGDGRRLTTSGLLQEEQPPPPDSDYYMCARRLAYTYTMVVDPSCTEVYSIQDLELATPQRCCWYFDCIECSVNCEPTN